MAQNCTKTALTCLIATAYSCTDQPANACQLPTTLAHSTTAVVDARTLKLDDDTELRLASILGPTPYDSPAAPKQWPTETAAIQALSRLALNQNVAISLERVGRDRYGRRVGQVLLASHSNNSEIPIENRWLQAILVCTGHARVTLTPETDAACANLLLTLEADAESSRRGLWSHALYQPKRAEDVGLLNRYRSTYQIIEGVVNHVAVRRSTVYFNFGPNWKRDFTAKLRRSMLKRADIKINTLKNLKKSPIRVRGWIEKRNGPMITIWRLEQIELLTLDPNGKTRRHTPPRLLSKPTNSKPTRQ